MIENSDNLENDTIQKAGLNIEDNLVKSVADKWYLYKNEEHPNDIKVLAVNDEINKLIDEAKPIAFNNAVEDWKNEYLYNSDSGYLAKGGVDVSGKSDVIIEQFDRFVDKWMSDNNLNAYSYDRISKISTAKRKNILNIIKNYDKIQTEVWIKDEGATALDNAIQNGIKNRNNYFEIDNQAMNIKQLTQWQGHVDDLDDATISFHQRKNNSDFLAKILDAKLENKDINSREFFNRYKKQIDVSSHEKYLQSIREVEICQLTKDWTDEILSKSKDKQTSFKMFEAYKPKMDKDVHSFVKQNLEIYYKQKDFDELQKQNEILKKNYELIENFIKQNKKISYEMVDFANLNSDNIKILQNYINNKNENNDNKTQNKTYKKLLDMSLSEFSSFKTSDLTQYRGLLSDEDYSYFKNLQTTDIPLVQREDIHNEINDILKSNSDLSDEDKLDIEVKLNRDIYSEISFAKKESDKKITPQDIQKIIENRKEMFSKYFKKNFEKTNEEKSKNPNLILDKFQFWKKD